MPLAIIMLELLAALLSAFVVFAIVPVFRNSIRGQDERSTGAAFFWSRIFPFDWLDPAAA